MIKFGRFLFVITAMITIFPSIGFGASAPEGIHPSPPEGIHPLAAASPAHMSLLKDPIYQYFQHMKERPYPRDMEPAELKAEVNAAMDRIPMGDFRDLWVVHKLLGQLYGFAQDVGEYAASKVAGLKDHPDKNMRSMAMYCWALGNLHALQKGQKDAAIGILNEVFRADISDYLKIKLAGHWPAVSDNLVAAEDSAYGPRRFETHLFGYTLLGDMDGALSPIFRPYFLWKKARKTFTAAPWEYWPERLGVIDEAVKGSDGDPYYSTRAKILEAFAPRSEDEAYNAGHSRIERLESIDSSELPPEINLQLLQDFLCIYSYWSSKMSPEELEGRSEKIIEYGTRILALGDSIPGTSRYSAINVLLAALSSRPPEEGMSLFARDHVQAIRLFDEREAYRRAHGLTPYLEDIFDLIRLFFNGEAGIRDLPRARAILAEYEAIKKMEKNPSLYIFMMELYAVRDVFNEPELLKAAARISALAAEARSVNGYIFITREILSNPKAYFMDYLVKIVKQGEAATALKVLDVLSNKLQDYPCEEYTWEGSIKNLVLQFLQFLLDETVLLDNPRLEPVEARQKLLMFIEPSLAKIPMGNRFKLLKGRLEHLAGAGQWGEAIKLYGKLLDRTTVEDETPGWNDLARHAIKFFSQHKMSEDGVPIPRVQELIGRIQARLDHIIVQEYLGVLPLPALDFEILDALVRLIKHFKAVDPDQADRLLKRWIYQIECFKKIDPLNACKLINRLALLYPEFARLDPELALLYPGSGVVPLYHVDLYSIDFLAEYAGVQSYFMDLLFVDRPEFPVPPFPPLQLFSTFSVTDDMGSA